MNFGAKIKEHLVASGQVLTGAGTLRRVVIGSPTTVAGDITLYDEADDSQTATAIITVIAMDTAANNGGPKTIEFDCDLTSGLYVLFGAGVANADVTVICN